MSALLRSGDLFGLTEVTSNFGVFSVCDCASPMDATSVIPIHFRFMAFLRERFTDPREIWWREGDSNSRPTDYETVALAA